MSKRIDRGIKNSRMHAEGYLCDHGYGYNGGDVGERNLEFVRSKFKTRYKENDVVIMRKQKVNRVKKVATKRKPIARRCR